MRIQSTSLELQAEHQARQHSSVKLTIEHWGGRQAQSGAAVSVSLSDAGQAALKNQDVATDTEGELGLDARTSLLLTLIEKLTGHKVRIFRMENLGAAPAASTTGTAAPPVATAGGEIRREVHFEEGESTQFAASGRVLTADGREIAFNLELNMARYFQLDSSERLQWGAARQQKDPLVLNFSGSAAALQDQRFEFDLEGNGQQEAIPTLAAGSAYLVFDRNGDGRVNDGRELFGPQTGNAYAELATLDEDGNGWIDEGDAAFSRLGVWSGQGVAGAAGQVQSLAERGVGAVAVSHLATPFSLRNGQNQSLGEIRASGLYLLENGAAGSTQQIDLSI